MNQVLIFGRRKQGKSTLSLALAMLSDRMCVVFDPNAQYDVLPCTSQGSRLLAYIESGYRAVAYRPSGNSNVETEFAALSDALWPPGEKYPFYSDFSLLIDEASCVQSHAWIHPKLERWLRLAPRDVVILQATHRPTDTHRLARSLATDVFLFQNASAKDIALIEQEWESRELAEAVARLGLYQCAHYTLTTGGQRRFWVWPRGDAWKLDIAGEQDGRRDTAATIDTADTTAELA